ncbi:MAG: tyrosine-type recombinase/integrase, partial [Clostridia bacterium]|nr:tyrosine-type recombinase/integrase [Clostridia bacterium]
RSLYIQAKIIDLVKQLQVEQQEQANKCGDLWVQSDRLFTTWCGKPMHPNTPYTWLKRFCERENVSFKGLHSFRHFVATQAIASGIDIKSVSAMLGHSQTSTTLNIYAHAVQQTNEKALSTIANLLETA